MIKHILADGTETDDISGKVIEREELPEIYKVKEELEKDALFLR